MLSYIVAHSTLIGTHVVLIQCVYIVHIRIIIKILYIYISRLTIVSREAKKKQAVRDEQVSYLHVAPL